jgi:hypothetical protein
MAHAVTPHRSVRHGDNILLGATILCAPIDVGNDSPGQFHEHRSNGMTALARTAARSTIWTRPATILRAPALHGAG